MQVFESEDKRLGPRPPQNPGGHCRQLLSPPLFRREIRGAVRRQRDVNERCEQGRMFGWVETGQTQRAFEVGEALLGWRIRTKTEPPPFGDWMERRVLQKLRGAPLAPGMRCLRQLRMELFDQPRLAEAGLAYDQHELAFARASALPAAREQPEFFLAADERREGPPAASSAAAAGANDAEELDGPRHALEFARALLLDDKEPRHLSLDIQSDEDRAGLGLRLHPRGDIGRIAEHLAAGFHDDRPGLKAHAGSQAPPARHVRRRSPALADSRRGPSTRRQASSAHARLSRSPPPRLRRDRR